MFPGFDAFLRGNARERGDTIAIESPDQDARITFGEVDAVTTRLARWLRARGIGAGGRVSLLADNSIEALLVFWAVLRAGGVINPVNVEIREKNIRQILQHVRPHVVLWSRDLPQDVRALGEADDSWVAFGDWRAPAGDLFAEVARHSAEPLEGPAPGADSLAVIDYTSGTTDTPKGVMWTAEAYYRMSESSFDRLEMGPGDTLLDYRHFSWSSPQILSIGPSMFTGATLVLARKFSQGRFFDWIRSYGVTVAVGIPTVINMLLSRPAGVTKADLPTLRFMTSSTAPLSVEKHTEFERLYGFPIVQLAGSTETGFMAGNHPGRRTLGSIGRPTRNMTVRILDDAGHECAPGQEGEMVVSGPQMAFAYLTDVDTVVPIPQDGFRTGDMAYRDADGYVHISGRRKDIIIKGGVNIAALEVTNAVLQHPEVAEAATLGVPDDIYGEAVVTFVVARPGASPTATGLLGQCRQRLAEFKVPKSVVLLDAIPKNTNGKVAKDELLRLWGARAGR